MNPMSFGSRTYLVEDGEILYSNIDESPVVLDESRESIPLELQTLNFALCLSCVQPSIRGEFLRETEKFVDLLFKGLRMSKNR